MNACAVFEPHPLLKPGWGSCDRYPKVDAWRICLRNTDAAMLTRTTDLAFGRKRDVEIAIESFRREGILTRADINALTDAQIRHFATRDLQW